MTSSSPKTVNPLNYNFPNRLSFPLNRLNPSYSYDQAYLNELKVLNQVPIDDSPFLSLFESDNEYYTNNLLPRRSSDNPRALRKLNPQIEKLDVNKIDKTDKTDKNNKNKVKKTGRNTLPKINRKNEDISIVSDDSDQYYVNYDGRLTSFRDYNQNPTQGYSQNSTQGYSQNNQSYNQNNQSYNPLKNPSVHDYLFSLANKGEHESKLIFQFNLNIVFKKSKILSLC